MLWTVIKGKAGLLWAQYKLYICLGILIVTAVWSFQQGKESCQKAAVRALEKELKAQEERSAEAIKKATQAAAALNQVKERGNDLRKEAAELPVAAECKPTDDELRVLREIRQATANQ